ncbi:unnamed protein product [Calypogeia fissa]
MAEALETGNLILICAQKILELGNNWYEQDWGRRLQANWKFARHVDRLKRHLEIWETESHNRDLSSHVALTKTLSATRSCLEEEQKNLETKESAFRSGCLSMGRTPFPVQVGLSIQDSIDAFTNIEEMLESQKWKHTARFEDFRFDNRYVALKDSEDKIYQALDNVNGPQVVLLHGAAGKGKSTVALSTVVHYSRKTQFDHVFFLNCGPQVTISDIQFELIQRIGSLPLANLQGNQNMRSVPIPKQVKTFLADRNVLLILDNASEGEFLRELVNLCSHGVKCLVTSQLGSLCGSLDPSKFVSIEIQDVDPDTARKILATRLGLDYNIIPPHVQEIADKMICETEFNPLALASLASVIDRELSVDIYGALSSDDSIEHILGAYFGGEKQKLQSQEVKEWETVSLIFFRALESEVPAELFHGKYPRSLWATTGVNISTLSQDALTLLLLVHAFEGPSVPEEVIRVLFASMKLEEKSRAFSRCTIELESRQLIKINAVPSAGPGLQMNWEVHSLQKRYIEAEMTGARQSILASLAAAGCTLSEGTIVGVKHGIISDNVPNSDHLGDAVVTALCALYLDKQVAGKAAAKMDFPLKHFSKQKRNAIEPVTRLLALPDTNNQTTATARECARKVFLGYVCNSALEDLSISELLRNSTGAIAMCRALRDIAIIEENCFLSDERSQEFMKALVNNMAYIWIQSIRKTALEIVANLSQNEEYAFFIVSFTKVLDGIVRCLNNIGKVTYNHKKEADVPRFGPPPVFDCYEIASSYTIVAQGSSGEIRKRIKYATVVTTSFTKEEAREEPKVEDYAAIILSKLALGADEIKIKIATHPGLLEGLARWLHSEGITSGIAAHTLMTLALADIEIIRERVKATEAQFDLSVIHGLVSLVEGAPNRLNEAGSGIFDFYSKEREYFAAVALTMFDPVRGNQLTLRSGRAYGGRGHANFAMHSDNKALEDLVKAHELEPEHGPILSKEREYCAAVALTMFDPDRGNQLTLRSGRAYGGRGHANFAMRSVNKAQALEDLVKAHEREPEHAPILRDLRTLKAKTGYLQEALSLANKAIATQGLEDADFDWQERGIIKCMLDDLPGALEDLNRGLELKPDDYEILKHRGYVKSLLGDAIGAQADGNQARSIQGPSVNHPQYGSFSDCLGANSVQYMEFELK